MSYDHFIATDPASWQEGSAIGGTWRHTGADVHFVLERNARRIARMFEVPDHLVGDWPDPPPTPSEFIRSMAASYGLAVPTNPDTKENDTMTTTRITISASFGGGSIMGSKPGPKVEAEVMGDQETSGLVELVSQAQFSAGELAASIGIAPYVAPSKIEITGEGVLPGFEIRDAEVQEADGVAAVPAVEGDPDVADLEDEGDAAIERQRRAMHKAISDQCPNLRDFAGELDTEGGNAAPTEERSRVLAHAIITAAEALEESRNVEVPE